MKNINRCSQLQLLLATLFTMCITTLANAAAVSGQGTWETTLQPRDLDGNLGTAEAYYDTALNITWLSNANAAVGSTYDTVWPGHGPMTWATANAWAASLNPYGSGITGWRLPITNPVDGTTADDANPANDGTEDLGANVSAPGTLYAGSTASEMAYMFYNTLGNESCFEPFTPCSSGTQTNWGLTNTGPFSNVEAYMFWSATEYAPDTSFAWIFAFDVGFQGPDVKTFAGGYHAWAVHDGDVGASPVPVPAAFWLFGSGLVAVFGYFRKKNNIAT